MKTTLDYTNELFYKQFARYPNLDNPTGFNDKIQWLKIYDQHPEQVICCDKIAVKEWVTSKLGKGYTVPESNGSYPMVIKSNHGSGGVKFANNKAEDAKFTKIVKSTLSKPYGVDKGEWGYQYIRPAVMKENRLTNLDVDYKFHCVNGEVIWLQMIWDRFSKKTKESIIDPNGKPMGLHFDEKMMHANDQPICGLDNFYVLKKVAEELSKGWKYIRVDLYWANNIAIVGELTFWPKSGCYRTPHEPVFGKMLDIDITSKNEVLPDTNFRNQIDSLYKKYKKG